MKPQIENQVPPSNDQSAATNSIFSHFHINNNELKIARASEFVKVTEQIEIINYFRVTIYNNKKNLKFLFSTTCLILIWTGPDFKNIHFKVIENNWNWNLEQ